jgi:hypothetical protein
MFFAAKVSERLPKLFMKSWAVDGASQRDQAVLKKLKELKSQHHNLVFLTDILAANPPGLTSY